MERFAAGQVWKYETRPSESDSALQILKIEFYEDIGTVLHIAVFGIQLTNPDHPSKPHDDISHLPFAEQAITESVTALVGTMELPDLSEGYHYWRDAFKNSDAGVSSISVKETEEYPKEALNKGSIIDDLQECVDCNGVVILALSMPENTLAVTAVHVRFC